MGKNYPDVLYVDLRYSTPFRGGEYNIEPHLNPPIRHKCEAGCRGAGDVNTYNPAFFHCGGKYPVGQCVPHAKFTDRDQLQFDLAFEFKPADGINLADYGLPDTHTEKGINWNPLGAFDSDAIFTRGAITPDGEIECGHPNAGFVMKACIRCKASPTPGQPPQFWMNQTVSEIWNNNGYYGPTKLGVFHVPSGICSPIPQNIRDDSNKYRNLFFEHGLELLEPIQCEPFTVKLRGHLMVSQAVFMGSQSYVYRWMNTRVAEFTLTISNPEKIADFTGQINSQGGAGLYFVPSASTISSYVYNTQPGDHPWLPTGRYAGGLFNPTDTPPNKYGESMVGVCPDLLNNTQPIEYCVKLEWVEKTAPAYIKPEMDGTLQFTARHIGSYYQVNDLVTDKKIECVKIIRPYDEPMYSSKQTPIDCDPREEMYFSSLNYATYLRFNQDINARRSPFLWGTMWNDKEWGWDLGYYWNDWNQDPNHGGSISPSGNVTITCNPFSMVIDRIPVYYNKYRQALWVVGYFKATITLRDGWIPKGQCTPMEYGADYYDFGSGINTENRCRQAMPEPYNYGVPAQGPFKTLKDCFTGQAIPKTPKWYLVSGQCVESVGIPPGASDGPFDTMEQCSGCRQPPNSKKWYCVSGNCAQYDTQPPGSSGPFETKTVCDSACSTPVVKKWYCVSGACGEFASAPPGATGGPFDTQQQCQSTCQPIPPPPKYWCVGNTCVQSVDAPPGATAGPFDSLDLCGASCVDPLLWWCLDGNCSESRTQPAGSSGPFTTEADCKAICLPPPVPMVWVCMGGTCVQYSYEDAVNSGFVFYGSQSECSSHCTTPPNPYIGYYCLPVTNTFAAGGGSTPTNTCIQWGNPLEPPAGAIGGKYDTLADCEAGCNQTPGALYWCVAASDGTKRCVMSMTQPPATVSGPYNTSTECSLACGMGVTNPPVDLSISHQQRSAPVTTSSQILARVKLPCVHLGDAVEDPSKCGCGVAVLRKCDIHGTCRTIGYPKAGESICAQCPDYMAPATVQPTG
jgi:hypothetical protein